MTHEHLRELGRLYRDTLLGDCVPFWTRFGVDPEHGGIMTSLDRDGTVIDTDKGIWQQGRFAWLMSTLYATVEPREEWMAHARATLAFLDAHGFDADGQMFFQVTREGRPLRKRRYVFSEAFASAAFAARAGATGDQRAAARARAIFGDFLRFTTTPGLLHPKVRPDVRPMRGLGVPMITINLAQVIRETIGDPRCDGEIDRAIDEIRRYFMKPELEAVLETVGPAGELIDHFDGRTLNPGHAIEAAWFILHEALHRGRDPELIRTGTRILDWMWARGWDDEYGGLFYYRDVRGLPVQEYWHDMKFWWPHCEAIIATLLAFHLTGEERYARWHSMVHEWSFAHFPDPEHGEWYGYLHRDGRVSVPLKGNLWKGAFHLPRMLWYCMRLTERSAGDGAPERATRPPTIGKP